MGSPILCDHCNMGSAIIYCKTHLDHSRFLLCNKSVSQAAAVQCVEQRFCPCQTCISNVNATSRFLLSNIFSNNSGYSFPPDLDLVYTSSFSSSSFINLNWGFPFVSLLSKNGDLSLPSRISQNFDNHTKNCSDQQVQMLHPDYLDISKDCLFLGFEGNEAKDIENVWLNTFDNEKTVLDQKEYSSGEEWILTDQLIDEIRKHNAETMTEVLHKDYNIEDLANASGEDYEKNQIIGLKAKEETNNNFGIFDNAHSQLECRPWQLIMTDEMLPWEDQTLASGIYTPARLEAVKRYFAKKKKRKFGKQIRYESRKSTADTKKRLKGRFTKAGAEYDYDPRANNTNKG